MTRLAPMLPRGYCGPAPKRFDRDIHAGYYVRCASVTTSSLDAPRHLACMPDIWASASWLGASHNVNMAGILAHFGLIYRRVECRLHVIMLQPEILLRRRNPCTADPHPSSAAPLE